MILFSVDLDEVKKYRHRWLRPDLETPPIYEGDVSRKAKHLVWIYGDQICGIASIVPDMKKIGADNIQWRLRAMAIDPNRRGNGNGEDFLRAVLEFAKQKNMYPIYGSGRESAESLYSKLGAKFYGDPYDMTGTGSHRDFMFAD